MATSPSPALLSEYSRLKLSLKLDVLGLVLIGSRARGQAISLSDYDTRLMVRSDEPFVVMSEPTWTRGPDVTVAYLEWADLNRAEAEGLTFGLTNLGYVERFAQAGIFPLSDHTALFQGEVLIDEVGQVRRCYNRYFGVSFANVAADYLEQTRWRVEQRLRRELEAIRLGEGLDTRKQAIPALHTCCRIVHDITQIAAYRQSAIYLDSTASVEAYYAARWPWFGPSLRSLLEYKTDETQRRVVFEQVARREAGCLRELEALVAQTVRLWGEFAGTVA